MALSIWNVTPVVCIAATSWAGRLASGLAGIVDVIDIPDVIHSFDHKKLSSISQLINCKSRNL